MTQKRKAHRITFRKSLKILLLLVPVLWAFGIADDSPCKTVGSCSRSAIEGLWSFEGAPLSFIMYKPGNKASEALGEVFVTIDYDIEWKTGCNHDLVVRKVNTTPDTPDIIKAYLQKPGERVAVEVHEVTSNLYRYTMTRRGKSYGCTVVHKVQGEFVK